MTRHGVTVAGFALAMATASIAAFAATDATPTTSAPSIPSVSAPVQVVAPGTAAATVAATGTNAAASASVIPPPAAGPAVPATDLPARSAAAPTTTMSPAPSASASMPTLATTPSATSFAGSFQMLFGLFIVLGLLFGVTWLLKKYGPVRSATTTAVKIVGGINVGNRERIIVVEVADQWIVVGVAPGRVNTLSTMPKQDSIAVTDSSPPEKNFAAWLKQTIDKRNGK